MIHVLLSLFLFTLYSSQLLGSVIVRYSDNDIAFFVTCLDIPVGLNYLFQRIASIYGRLYLSRLHKLFEENYIFSLFACYPKYYFLAACH